MVPAEALVAALKDDTGVAALVGTRIYPVRLPIGTSFNESSTDLPALVYQLITERVEAGALRFPRFQLTAFAMTYESAHAVAEAVRDALDGYESANVRASAFLDARDMSDPELAAYMVPIDIRFGFI